MTWMLLLKWEISIKDTQSWINSVFFKRLNYLDKKKWKCCEPKLGFAPKVKARQKQKGVGNKLRQERGLNTLWD
jgi:hypothetical protein